MFKQVVWLAVHYTTTGEVQQLSPLQGLSPCVMSCKHGLLLVPVLVVWRFQLLYVLVFALACRCGFLSLMRLTG